VEGEQRQRQQQWQLCCVCCALLRSALQQRQQQQQQQEKGLHLHQGLGAAGVWWHSSPWGGDTQVCVTPLVTAAGGYRGGFHTPLC
jgi:hypothetical protein